MITECREYKGFEIYKITHNTYIIKKDGEKISMDKYPRTLKEAKAIVDTF